MARKASSAAVPEYLLIASGLLSLGLSLSACATADRLIPWQRTYGGPEDDWANEIAMLPDGGFIVAGWTESTGAGKEDAWLLRLDCFGTILWERTCGGGEDEKAIAVAVPPGGGFIVAGSTASKGAGKGDVWVLRLDPSGRLLWERTYGGGGDDRAYDVPPLPGGGFLVAGRTESKGTGGNDAWLPRLDSSGNLLWERAFGGGEDDNASAVAALPGGGVMVAGNTESKGTGSWDAWILRLDARGALLWDRTLGNAGFNWINAAAALSGGKILMAGVTFPAGERHMDAWLIRLGDKSELGATPGAAPNGRNTSPPSAARLPPRLRRPAWLNSTKGFS